MCCTRCSVRRVQLALVTVDTYQRGAALWLSVVMLWGWQSTKRLGPQPGWLTGGGPVRTHQPIARSLGTMKNGADFIFAADVDMTLKGCVASGLTYGHNGKICKTSWPLASCSL